MRTVIVTQQEPFYIPMLVEKVLSELKSIVGIIILPGIPSGFNLVSYVKGLYDVFSLRDFLIYGALFTYYKMHDLTSRWRRNQFPHSIQSVARRNAVPVYRLKSINSRKALELVKSLSPEIIISVASPQIFNKRLISLANHVVNIHAALLPQYQGMMPSFWVLADGKERTGVTIHYMDEHIDTGDIILQRPIDISPEDTLHSLQRKVAKTGAVALLEALAMIEENRVTRICPSGPSSYYSFPTKEAAIKFRQRGRKFI